MTYMLEILAMHCQEIEKQVENYFFKIWSFGEYLMSSYLELDAVLAALWQSK